MAFDKDKYRENRKAGRRGQGEMPKPVIVYNDNNAEQGFDNDGRLVVRNRAYRRKRTKLPGDNSYTKKKAMTKTERKEFRKLGRR